MREREGGREGGRDGGKGGEGSGSARRDGVDGESKAGVEMIAKGEGTTEETTFSAVRHIFQ